MILLRMELVELKTDNMKLELKHLAPYLPYGLKYRLHGNFPIQNGVDNWIEDIREISPFNFTLEKVLTWETCKPILRPLSDLTKEIEINGERFVPSDKLMLQKNQRGEWSFFMDEAITWEIEQAIEDVSKLFEWHFDVFGLIDQGLAIDINTLYK